MASVEVFPELRVAVASEDAQESLTLLHSNHVDDLAPHTTLHHLEVTSGTRFAILLTFNTYALRANPASCIEVSLTFDGFFATHCFVNITEIVRNAGQVVLKTFADGFTGMSRTAEFRTLTTAASSAGEDADTLLRAQQIGVIRVNVRYGAGLVAYRAGALQPLRHDGSYSDVIRRHTRATHYIHYGNPSHNPTHPGFMATHYSYTTGCFVFHYGSREALGQVDRVPEVDPPRANTLLHGHNPSNNNIAGVQSTASTNHLQQPGTSTSGNFSAPPNHYPTTSAYVHPPSAHDPRMRISGAYPAPGFDAYGRPLPDSNMGSGAPAMPHTHDLYGRVLAPGVPSHVAYPSPTAVHPNGRTNTGPVNNNLAPPPVQREVSDRRASTQASQLNSASATIGRNGIPTKAPAQTQATTSSAGADVSSLPVTTQVQSAIASAGASVTSHSVNPQAVLTPATSGRGCPSLPAPSQAQTTTASTGVGVPSFSANPQAQTTTASTGVGVPSFSANPQAVSTPAMGGGGGSGGGLSSLPTTSQARSTTASAGAGRSALPVASQAQSMTAPAGAGVSSRIYTAQIISPPATGGAGASSLSASSQTQSTTAFAGAGISFPPAVTQSVSATGTGSGGVPSIAVATQPLPTTGVGSGGVSSSRANPYRKTHGGLTPRFSVNHSDGDAGDDSDDSSDDSDGPPKKKCRHGGT